jgi:hypothetical protein
MKDHPLALRRNVIHYPAPLAVLAAGYAFATSDAKTLTVCADKKAGILHPKTRGGRCNHGQAHVTWNHQGPAVPQGSQDPQGATGAQGTQGPAGVAVWANVTESGAIEGGQGLAVQPVSAGAYQVTVTDLNCAGVMNAPVASLSDSPPGSARGGQFSVAWYGATGPDEEFMVYTGLSRPHRCPPRRVTPLTCLTRAVSRSVEAALG